MRKIVIIGVNDFQNQLILKAKEMGFETHVFAWQDGSIGERTADHFYPVSIVEIDEIIGKCREIGPDAVATIASDLANITVSHVAAALRLPGNSPECIELSTNKFAMREAFRKAGLPVPAFYRVDRVTDELYGMKLPLIVKPTDRSGSRAITKINDFAELPAAIENAVGQSFEKQAIVEEYIEGDEYSYEAISYKGKHTNLAVTKKFTTGAPHFIETGHLQPSGLSGAVLEKVHEVMFAALDALKITDGASHGEFKVTPDGEIRLIEIGSRMGGDCIGSDLVPLSTGYDFMEMVIDVACGHAPRLVRKSAPRQARITFLFTEDDVAEMRRYAAAHPDEIYRISELDMSHAGSVTDSSTRIGYYITVK
ncbi:MAG: ATP-grasp domain-containing protein [Lachnospiraceae bacterium]|nr:ATP-grasp domain-containing protein [Lachnospiraceae bacterium]